MSALGICPTCGNPEARGARFCSRCGTALDDGPRRERRTQVSIVFCDLAGSTALGERLDPEVLRNVQERYFACAAAALRAHGGEIEKYIGDAVMCVFGLPAMREDDALRAARGALDLVAAVEALNRELLLELGIELAVRVGVNTGEVVAAGDHSRGQALVTGDAVNTAARLEQAAPSGGILMGALTRRLLAHRVHATEVAPIDAKGKALPLEAWQLLGEAEAAASPLGAPLVGRSHEVAALRTALVRVESERTPEIALVTGEPGIGKSRLVADFVSGLTARVVAGACPSYGRGNTYRPLRDVIDSIAPAATQAELVEVLGTRPDSELVALHLMRVIGREAGPVTKTQAFTAVARLLAALGDEESLVVVIEDLHWAEPTFLDLLVFLQETVAAPILIVGTARDELLGDRPELAERLVRLEPLDDAQAAELLSSAGLVDEATLGDLVARAGGNPLFLEHLAAWGAEGGRGIPPDLAGLIGARIDLVDARARRVVEAAAVVGRDFLLTAVAALLSDEPVVDVPSGFARLEALGFVAPGTSDARLGPTGLSGVFAGARLHFRHALVVDAVLAGMPKARRAVLHERLAEDLQRRPGHEPALVGHHLEQAALLRMELRPRDAPPEVALAAASQLEHAGLLALEHGDSPAATLLLSRARDLLPPSAPRRADVEDALERSRVSQPAPALDELSAGSLLGGYVIEGTAGRGGMAIVYRAHDPDLERLVALKVIAPALADQPSFRERFVRESRIAAGIDQPSVIPVYRAGEDQGCLFIAMRYLRGGDLAQRLRRSGRLAVPDAARCVHDVALALDAAHARGLVHRDVKPANIMLDGVEAEQVYLTDFGLSNDQLGPSDLTKTGQWVGTVAYSAPEQVRGARADARADVYALGGVLYHLLTGEVPFPAASELDALAAHLTESPPRPSRTVADVPRAFDAVVARAMAKDPAQRYASAGDLGRAAVAAAAGARAPHERGSVAQGAAAPGALAGGPRSTAARSGRWRRVLPLGVGAAALVAAGLTALLTRGTSGNAPRNPAGAVVGKPVALTTSPDRLAVTTRAIWSLSRGGPTILRVDTRSRTVRTIPLPFNLGGGPYPDITADDRSVWVAHALESVGGVERVADTRGRAPVHVSLARASAVATASGAVWAATDPGGNRLGSIVRIDASTAKITARLARVGLGAVDIAVSPGAVWVAFRRSGIVARVDARRLRVTARVRVGNGPARLAIADGTVWVLNADDRTISRIDMRSNATRGAPISLGKELDDIATGGAALWVASADRTVTRLDAATGTAIGSPIVVGAAPVTLAADADGVWVGSRSDNTLERVDSET